jgi:hypothetical protein
MALDLIEADSCVISSSGTWRVNETGVPGMPSGTTPKPALAMLSAVGFDLSVISNEGRLNVASVVLRGQGLLHIYPYWASAELCLYDCLLCQDVDPGRQSVPGIPGVLFDLSGKTTGGTAYAKDANATSLTSHPRIRMLIVPVTQAEGERIRSNSHVGFRLGMRPTASAVFDDVCPGVAGAFNQVPRVL